MRHTAETLLMKQQLNNHMLEELFFKFKNNFKRKVRIVHFWYLLLAAKGEN
jgi:hypothetical protein